MDLAGKQRDHGGPCPFCDIVAGRSPKVALYEDEHVLSFLDIRPLLPGHALVIPKAHCKDLRDCPEAALKPLMDAVRLVAPALLKALEYDGFNLVASNGEPFQEVYHLHFHIMPRKVGDGFTRTALSEHVGRAKRVRHAELEPLGEKVRALLAPSPAGGRGLG